MTWVERVVDETGLWARVHTPNVDGTCALGCAIWIGEHDHYLDDDGELGVIIRTTKERIG